METHSPLVALSQTAPGDKTSRRLQADFADSFKPLERFDCPGTVSLISFKNCQIIMDKYGYIIIISKSPGKMVHDFCIQAKVEDATSNWLVMDVRRMIVAKKDGSTKNLDIFHHLSGG